MSMTMNARQVRVVDPVLSTVARGFRPQELVGSFLFPRVPVPISGGTILEFGREEFRQYNLRRAPGGATKRLPMGYGSRPYALVQDAVDVPVPREYARDAQASLGLNLGTIATQKGMRTLMLALEVERANLARNTASYAASNRVALGSGARFSDAGVDPMTAIEAGKEAVRAAIGVYPNTICMGARVMSALRRNAAMLDRIKYTQRGVMTEEILAEVFEVERVVVGKGITVDQADVATDVWGTDVIMAYTAIGAVDNAQPSFAYTYEMEGHPLVEQPYYDTPHKSWFYPVAYERAPVVAGNTAGYLIQTAAA
jgi:hypothetical protein